MKKISLLLMLFFLGHTTYALNKKDSIAILQIKELGVYYLHNDTIVKITPIMPENTKVRANPLSVKSTLVYEGEVSEHILVNEPEFFIFIPKEYKTRINVKQFRLVTLSSKNGKRKINVGSFSMLGSRTGAKTKTFDIMTLNEECYKIFAKEPMPIGHYGIFYNYYGGIPGKLYDFDIRE